jgi:hypothetical protein
LAAIFRSANHGCFLFFTDRKNVRIRDVAVLGLGGAEGLKGHWGQADEEACSLTMLPAWPSNRGHAAILIMERQCFMEKGLVLRPMVMPGR